MKKLNNKLTPSIMLQCLGSGYFEVEDGEYTPEKNDITQIYKRGNEILLQIDFVKDGYLPPGFKIVCTGEDKYTKIKTMTYSNTITYLKNKGYVLKDTDFYQVWLCSRGKKLTDLMGRLEEFWELPLTHEKEAKI